ncbi:MAG: alpha-mannosidase [Prochlorococcaceae cyanobacterium]
MTQALPGSVEGWIETISPRLELDLLPLLRRPDGQRALEDPWGRRHRPDWHARGLAIWPRGGRWLTLTHALRRPAAWGDGRGSRARLVLRWWAEAAEVLIDGQPVVVGDLFDAACRWSLPAAFWQGETLTLTLRLRSPRHDDGALLLARVEREPLDRADPDGLLRLGQLRLLRQRLEADPAAPGPTLPGDEATLAGVLASEPPAGRLLLVSHAHLDLAWLWPVADTWQAAERTFQSVLGLMDRWPALRFGHSTPALYDWLARHRPALFAAIVQRAAEGRWEPLNGPWVETDCVLVGGPSLLRQFEEGQTWSRHHFPGWRHDLAWLPDSFGFGAGLPAICAATGVRWFLTHKLFWNADNPFPHRLFRWRARGGAEVLALMTAPIGTDGDPLAMAREARAWTAATGLEEGLWLPGVGDHGGGPSEEMLEQLALWNGQPLAPQTRFGSVREHLESLASQADGLPVWRDELYLELHRGCATSRPDQKRHNRSLERLLREADALAALAGDDGESNREAWRGLLFQQFHDILPGTSVPEVFEQAEPVWRRCRRQSRRRRDDLLQRHWAPAPDERGAAPQHWWLGQLLPAAAGPRVVRLPQPPQGGHWLGPAGPLPGQRARDGGQWVQLAFGPGIELQRLAVAAGPGDGSVQGAVTLQLEADGRWCLGNDQLVAELGPQGVHSLRACDGKELLAQPLEWRRWADRGAFWDAWDLAADHRSRPLPFAWSEGPTVLEQGPLATRLRWRGHCGSSPLSLVATLRAASPVLELDLEADWHQTHELLRAELPLVQDGGFWAADTAAGVVERPRRACTGRERSRWEAAAMSWLWGGGLAVLLDGPQGVDGRPEGLGVSLLRGPTWPDPGADAGRHRQRLGLMPAAAGWWRTQVPAQAARFRQPLWSRPAAAGPAERQPLLDWPNPDLQLLQLTALPGSDMLELVGQQLGPCRGRWPQALEPWEVGRWRLPRLSPRGRRTDR